MVDVEELRRKAYAEGGRFCRTIIRSARRNELPIALGFALIEQESGFKNVWGGDRAPNGGTTGLQFKRVTKDRYLQYKRVRDRGGKGRGGMQGVGPAQLTYFSFQDRADALGGCWIAAHNIEVAFKALHDLVRHHGERKALAIYNGGARNPNYRYADQVLDKKRRWHRILWH